MDKNKTFELLSVIVKKGRIVADESMARHTSFKTGGNADIFIEPADKDELIALMRAVRENDLPFFIMGNGTNLLVSDEGVRAVVIKLGFSNITVDGDEIEADAGALLSAVANKALSASLTGAEFIAGIPGSLGGAVCMNAGAYGGEMKDILVEISALTKDGDVITIPSDKLDLGYRRSNAEQNGYVVLSGKIKLKKGDKDEIQAQMADYAQRRRDKQPLNFASAGSAFKRPEGYFAGKLIEDSGLKGYAVGSAMVSEKHAGFVVNTGGATTADILSVIRRCQDTVYEKFGVKLETEVKLIGI